MAVESYAGLQITVTPPHDTDRIIREKQMEALIHCCLFTALSGEGINSPVEALFPHHTTQLDA